MSIDVNRHKDLDYLQRLGGDHIDLYQFHLFDHETSIQETLNALNIVVRSREVRYLGALMKGAGCCRFVYRRGSAPFHGRRLLVDGLSALVE